LLSRLKNWLNGPKSPDAHPYYGERLKLASDHVALTRTNGDNAQMRLIDVDYVTIYRYANDDGRDLCWVNLKSYTHASLSCSTLAGNFHQLESLLLTWPGFDVPRYVAIKQSTQAHEEQVLWKKQHQPDFAIQGSAQSINLELLQHGLMIENAQQFIPWGSYHALSSHPMVKVTTKSFPNPRFKAQKYVLTRPVIANGLALKSLYTCCDAYDESPKLDLPVIEWTAEISLGVNRVNSFSVIQAHLDHFFGVNQQAGQPESARPLAGEDLQSVWQQGQVTFSLRAFYRDETKDWDNVAWLSIAYLPNLDSYYCNDYQQNLTLNQSLSYLRLDFALGLQVDYRQVDNAIYTPQCFMPMLDESNSLIWRDDAHGKIGLANATYARVFDLHEIEAMQLAVQNFRGSEGRNSLEILHEGQTIHVGGVSDVDAFKAAEKSIAKLIEKEVTHFTYDDHY
jgi:hypothetical protein